MLVLLLLLASFFVCDIAASKASIVGKLFNASMWVSSDFGVFVLELVGFVSSFSDISST
jgi:hypothetical protein